MAMCNNGEAENVRTEEVVLKNTGRNGCSVQNKRLENAGPEKSRNLALELCATRIDRLHII